MPLAPNYGATPVSAEDLEALLPEIRDLLGDPVSKAALYDLEQAFEAEVTAELLTLVLAGTLQIADLLADYFVRDLHHQLYGDIWTWAGVFRKREYNIGVAPEQIAVELRGSLESIRYRWEHTDDWTPQQLGIAVHAESVRIHPFTDGNGRTTRLLADAVFTAAQDGETAESYDWDVDKGKYIAALRQFDAHRDPRELAGLIRTRPLGE